MTFFRAANGSTESTEYKGKENSFCPSIGFEEDPETALAYPSPYNFCYHSKPIAPVSLTHQRKVCLTLRYGSCLVYKKEVVEPLPKELRGRLPGRQKPKSGVSLTILALVLFTGFAILLLLGIIRIPGLPLPLTSKPNIPTQTQPTTFVIVLPSSPTALASETINPTATTFTIIATPYTPHAIETPFGENPKLVIHQVQEGEGYILLAQRYGTTVEAIKAINLDFPESLWVNNILVIPINTDSVDGLPKFSVREITTEGLTIEDYAQRMQLDAAILKLYNALPDGYLLDMGDLIIVPN